MTAALSRTASVKRARMSARERERKCALERERKRERCFDIYALNARKCFKHGCKCDWVIAAYFYYFPHTLMLKIIYIYERLIDTFLSFIY